MQGGRRAHGGHLTRGGLTAFVLVVALSAALAGVALADAAASDGGSTVSVSVSGSSTLPSSPYPGARPGSSSGGSGSSSSPPAPSSTPSSCYWAPANSTSAVSVPPSGAWYVQLCPALNGGHPTTVVFVPASQSPPASAAGTSALALALQAERSILLPSPDIALNPRQYSITGLATWMWVASSWQGFSATVSAAGTTATARALPTSVRWDMGNGDVVVCVGPGVPYRGDIPAKDQHTNCSYTYRSTSVGQPSSDGDPDHGTFIVTATITWAVSWVSSVPGEGGPLPTLETSSSTPVRVEQVQSVTAAG